MRDIDIRRALRIEMDHLHPDKADTVIIEELGMCQGEARVDVAVVNGSVHGYEIKSARDTLTRLPGQAQVYSQALEFVTIIAATNHLAAVMAMVPGWWGIWIATKTGDDVVLTPSRPATRNPSLSSTAVVQFLWRDEALEILMEHDLANGISGKSRQVLWSHLTKQFTVEELGALVRSRLKLRTSSWRALA